MSDEALFSHLLICKNLEKATEILEERYAHHRHLCYVKNEFLLDDAKELVKEAYIAEAKTKYLLVTAKSYRVEAQNALLKILEEPPRNIVFILMAPSKNAFLPTIRSRLQCEELDFVQENVRCDLNLKKLDLSDIFPFVQANANLEKNLLKEMIQSIVFEAVHVHHLEFSERELEHFQKLLQLAELNSRAQTLLSSLLLSIMQRKRQ